MPNAVMVDLETMSSNMDAPIVAIGAVVFDPNGPRLDMLDISKETSTHCFYITVDLSSCIKYGLKPDGSTIYWWLKQSQEAREALTVQLPTDLKTALTVFDSWLETSVETPLKQLKVWAHANFDLAILDTAYKAVGRKEVPWKYFNTRDVRTISDLAFPDEKVPGVPHTGKHDALFDAARQAIQVQICYERLFK